MYSATMDDAPAGDLDELAVLVLDARGTVIAAEAACRRFFGSSRTELLGRALNGRAAGDRRTDEFIRRALEGYAGTLDVDVRGTSARIFFEPRRDQGGVLIVAQELRRDAYNDQTHARVDSLETIIEQAPGGVWATDRDLRFTFVIERVFETTDELVHRTLQELLGTSDPTDPTIAHHLAALAGKTGEYRVWFRGRLLQKAVKPLRNGGGEIIGTVGACVDITARVAAEDALAKAKRSLETAQHVAHVGSFEWDPEHGIIACSAEMCRIYGIEPGQLDGTLDDLLARVHPEDVQHVRSMLLKAYRMTEPLSFDHRIVQPDGRIRMLHCRAGTYRNGNGAVCIAGSCWDQTDLTQAKDDLEHGVSLLRGIIDATADGILVVDRSGRVTAYNRQFISLWRIPEDLVDARRDDELLTQVLDQLEDPGFFLQKVRDLYETPDDVSFDVLRLKDGRVYERKAIPQRIRDEVVGRVWSFRDVTGREQTLRAALFLNDVTRLLSSLDEDRALQSIAHLCVPYLGQVCAIDLIRVEGPRRFTAFSSERDVAPELHTSVMEGHQLEYMVASIPHVAAPLLRERTVIGAITLAAQPSRTFSEWDAVTIAELARRLSLAISDNLAGREAREALQARDEFLGIVAHELRGPLAAIHLSAQRLAKGGLTDTAKTSLLTTIAREDRRLARLLEEIVDLEKVRTGQLQLALEPTDLAEVAAAAVARLGPEIRKSGSAVSTSTDGAASGKWDRMNLERVVENLLRNAIKFGLGRPITIHIAGDSSGTATLVVEDRGSGIPAAMQDKIFRPFERAVSARYYGGLGLGLYVANAIVNALGGKIRVESEEGRGSRFTVSLPCSEDS